MKLLEGDLILKFGSWRSVREKIVGLTDQIMTYMKIDVNFNIERINTFVIHSSI